MDPYSLEVGELLSGVFLVADAKFQVDRRGQNYYSLLLNYEAGHQIEAKVWSDNVGARLEPGLGIEVMARVDEYMGARQLNVQRYRILSAGDFDVSRFIRTTSINVEEAFETLFNWARDEFQNPCFQRLMLEFHGSESFAREFKESPAASTRHHNYRGGLIEHTLDVWTLADDLCAHYAGRFERELLLCAAALHDIGKTKTYSLSSGVSQHTDVGHLLDHVFISASMVSNMWDRVVTKKVAEPLGERAALCKTLLLHIILSHHGKLQWGAPVLPQTPEAILIHYCDQVSASLQSCFDVLAARPAGEKWTQKLSIMDEARRFFEEPDAKDQP